MMMIMMMMMMIFIYCNLVSTRWQLLVGLYSNNKETAVYKRINNTQNNTKAQTTQNIKQTYKPENKLKKNTIKHKSSNK
jgi:hypothetical protein